MMDPKQREKCLKEVRLLESLDHPNIIKYLDSFIEDNQLYIAIEWAEKGDLKKLIKRAIAEELFFEERKIWEYLYQIACALKHMQDKRIMHRDLKPANIFLGADGTLKLGDLGLGRFMSSQTIEAFSRVGTPLYMSPEVLKGSGYDWKSDVWSLGCVIYELICQRSPFKREDEKMSLYDLFQTISKGEYPPLPSKYSEELKQIVNLMIQIVPQNRLSIDQVVELCEIQLKSIVKKSRADPYLIMDDICEKLKLLHYEKTFCHLTSRKPISRVYFAHCIEKNEQLKYFYDICIWIMSLRNPLQSPNFLTGRSDIDSLLKNLFNEVKNFGVKMPEFVTIEALKNGFGEAVCYIVNDLLNKELIRKDYKFEIPIIIENGVECYGDPPETMIFYEEIEAGIECKLDDLKEKYEEVEEEIILEEKVEIEENHINPDDWYAETERVSKMLSMNIDENISNGSKHLLIIKEKLTKFSSDNVLPFLELKCESINQSLNRIQTLEKRMQNDYTNELAELKEITEKHKKISRKNTKKKECIDDLLNNSQDIKSKKDIIDKFKPDSIENSKKQILYLKNSIVKLKKELSILDYRIGISRNKLDHYSVKKT